jgi:predicted RNA-binding Zn-ribbon protein involved in translation (DUF1610 family)
MNNRPKFVVFDDNNYQCSRVCDTRAEAITSAREIIEKYDDYSPITHVCRICPDCGDHEVTYRTTMVCGIETSWFECPTCGWESEGE